MNIFMKVSYDWPWTTHRLLKSLNLKPRYCVMRSCKMWHWDCKPHYILKTQPVSDDYFNHDRDIYGPFYI